MGVVNRFARYIFNMKKYLVLILFMISFLLTDRTVFAQTQSQGGFLDSNAVGKINNNIGVVQRQAGYDPNMSLGEVVAVAIRGFLGLLGVIFVILIIIAGYNWMTAGGDEEKIKKAGATIRSAIIGLIIVVAAYAITYFVFSNLPGSGVGGGAYGGS